MATLNDVLRRLARGMDAEMLGQESDRQLAERALADGDAAALQAIVHRHGAMVYRVCWRVLQHTQDTEDAFQATFLVLAQKLCTVRKHASLASWLHGVAYRVSVRARQQANARRRRESRASLSVMMPDEVTWKELRASLDAALSQLPDKWRLPLVLCYLEGRTQEEAAKRLTWSKSTLRSRLEEARSALARRLSRCGITLPAALSTLMLSDCVTSAAPAPGLSARAVEAAADVAAGKTLATAASTTVTALAEGVIKAMFTTKLKTVSVVLMAAAALVAMGIGTASFPALLARPTAQPVPVVELKPSQQPAAKDDPAASLVRLLGDRDFKTREDAAKKLRAVGVKALPALQAGTRDPDPEVAKRSHDVIGAIRADARDALAKQFDPQKPEDYDHPVWKRFKTIAGSDLAARKLFAEIIAEPRLLQLLDAADSEPDKPGNLYAAEVDRAFVAVQKILDLPTTGDVGPEVLPWPELPTILYLGTYPSSTGKVKDGWPREGHIFMPDRREWDKNPSTPALKRIFSTWLTHRDAANTLETGFAIAVFHDIKEAFPFARTVAADKTRPMKVQVSALPAVARFGTPADLPLFAPFFDQTDELASGRTTALRPIATQVRDYAVGLAVLLHDRDPYELGFQYAEKRFQRANGRPIIARFQLEHFGFREDMEREAAHQNAKAWLDEQSKLDPKK
jgi:RNA polymerase sigma factor (sigma-70 family)